MTLTSWLPYVTSRILAPLASDRKPRRGRRSGNTRLAGELLETRALLAVTWDGGGADFDWNNEPNWSADVVPGASDDVVIGSAFAAATISSGGSVSINNLTSEASLAITGGTFSIATTSTVARDLSLSATLTGSGSLTVSGILHWYGGTMSGTGTTTVLPGGTLVMDSGHHYLDGRTLVNEGTGIWTESHIFLNYGGVFTNAGTLDVSAQSDIRILSQAGGGTFNNTGTITRTIGTNEVPIYNGVVFNNSGTLSVQSGSWYSDAGGLSSGSFEVSGGANLTLYNHTLSGTSSVTGARSVTLGSDSVGGSYNVTGSTYVAGGLTDFTGTVTSVGDLTVGGTAEFSPVGGPATLTIPNLTVYGTLRGTDNFRVEGAFNWAGATLQGVGGQGSLTVLSNTTLNGNYTVRDFTLINDADMTWTGGTVQFYGSTSKFVNAVGAMFDDQTDGTFGSVDGNCIQFLNEGHFVKSGNAGVTNLQMQLYNRGTVEIQQGQLYLGCGSVSNDPGNPPALGIDYPPDHPPEYQNDDPIVVDAGTPPIVVPGSYTQTVNGLLIEQIAGHSGIGPYGTPGTDYGQLVVNGDVALNGNLQVQVLSPFVPTIGQQFLVIDNRGDNPIEGEFIDLLEGNIVWGGLYGFKVTYAGGTGNDFVLTMDRVANTPPLADAGGPYSVPEGGVLSLSAAGSSDAEQLANTLIYEWDLDGDAIFGESGMNAVRGDEVGISPVFSAAGLGGPGSFTVSVRVTDSYGQSDVDDAVIGITNAAPTAPVDNNFAANEVLENSPAGTLVGITAVSSDPGVLDTVTFSLTDAAGGRFAIHSSTGVVTVANGSLLDYETATSHSITVEASDGQGGKSTQTFTINLLNVTAAISGTVFVDADGDGLFDGGTETAIDAVMIELYHSSGGLLDTDLTELGGVYAFTVNDETATYRLREIQPTGVNNGAAILGSAGGDVLSANEMRLTLTGSNASDYDFTESGQAVQAGDTASIGFWQNKNGQALIKQGGAALVTWLNSNFGNIFGNTFSNGSCGDNAIEVASFYKNEFFNQKLKGSPKVDAQFMATALATFFTSSNLSGGTLAGCYGFNVTQTGLGTKVVNIGSSGAAFGVSNNTNMTIMSLLLATNNLTGAHANGYSNVYDTNGDGVLDNNEKALRVLANTIYSAINEGGHI